MKRKIVQILLCVVLSAGFIGCKAEPQAKKQENKLQSVKETSVDVDEGKQSVQEAQTESSETVDTEEAKPVQTEEENQKKQTATTERKPTKSTQTQKTGTNTQTTTANPTTETPKAEATPTAPTEPNATASDSRAVADKVLEYINSYRSTPAIKLPGLTRYAEYRSRQLIGNFAHDTSDERAAATALQYGTYIDPPLYGMTGEPYYAAGAREAIAKAGYVGSIDHVAERLASLVRNSAGHWAYVGSGEYPYIAVGVTYESGMWYCDIAMARENTDNN